MNRLLSCLLSGASLTACVFSANAHADDPLAGRYYVAPMVSLTSSERDDAHDVAIGGALAIGANWIPHIGTEIVADYLRYDHLQHIGGIGVGLNAFPSKKNEGLFAHADIESGDQPMYNAGLGFDRRMGSAAVSLRLEALWHKESHRDAEAMFRIGMNVPFGERPAPVPLASEPVVVVPVEESNATPDSQDSSGESTDMVPPNNSAASEGEQGQEIEVLPTSDAPSSGETPDATPVAAEPVTKQAEHRVVQAVLPPTGNVSPATSAAPAPEPAMEPSEVTSELADGEPSIEGVSDENAGTDARPASEDELAPTEPAPAPKGARDAPDTEPAQEVDAPRDVTDQSAESDDTLAPTEPAPRPR